MVNNVVVEGATFTLGADSPAIIVPMPWTLVVNSSANLKGKDGTKKASLKTDMEGQVGGTTAYTTPTYPTSGLLTWDGKLNGSHESGKLTKDTKGATTDKNNGIVDWAVGPPASAGTLTDPNTSYTGTWTITSPNNTVLTTIE